MPTANVAPGLCVEVKLVTAQLSLDVGSVHVTAALQLPASFVCVMSAGVFAMAGFSSSVMVTSKLAVVTLPWMSVAVNVTVVVPTGKVSPLLWLDVKLATAQLSEAVTGVFVSVKASNSQSTTAPH